MFKSHEKMFAGIQKLIDFLVLFLAWLVVYYFRFYLIPNAQMGLDLKFLKAGLLIAAIELYFFNKMGLYQSHRFSSRLDEVQQIVKAHFYSAVLFVVVLYFVASDRLSRSVLLAYFLVALFSILTVRLLLRNFLRLIRRNGRNLRHVLLVGNGNAIHTYVENIKSFPDAGIRFCGWIDSEGTCTKHGVAAVEMEINEFIRKSLPDAIIICYDGQDILKTDSLMRQIHNDVIPIIVLPDLTYSFVGYHVDFMGGVPALVVNQPNFSTVSILSKRMFDILASGFGLLLISPFLILIAIGVKMSSPGPVFFGQVRVGLDGKKFKMWKFRSMSALNVDDSAIPGWTTKDDPRKTKFGALIRSTSLDELPQLWNVLVGDMSLVGPRPEQPYYVEKFRNEIPAYMLRHKMKSGITGWAQVNGWRGDTSLHKRIECDLYYIRNWSVWFDVKILFMTFWKGFVNRNAY